MAYTVKHDRFEGPLALLLELIEKRELSVNEISLAKVTDDFISHLREIQTKGEADREALAEFLVVAAQLLLIKSRSLLPQFQVSAGEEASIHELEERLAEYKRIKELSLALASLASGGPKSFSREAFLGVSVEFIPPKNANPTTLASAFRGLVALLPKAKKLVQEKILRVISLEEKIKELQDLLQSKVERAFSEVVRGAKEKVEIIVSFLALLELTKQRLIAVEQKSLFADISFKKRASG